MRFSSVAVALAVGSIGLVGAPSALADSGPLPNNAAHATVVAPPASDTQWRTTPEFTVAPGESVTKSVPGDARFPTSTRIVSTPAHKPGEPRPEYSDPEITGSGTAEDPNVVTVTVTNHTDEELQASFGAQFTH